MERGIRERKVRKSAEKCKGSPAGDLAHYIFTPHSASRSPSSIPRHRASPSGSPTKALFTRYSPHPTDDEEAVAAFVGWVEEAMRGTLVLLALSSAAAFGGGKVIAGCLDPTASNFNTPGPVTLSIPSMCLFAPAPPAPPMGPGRMGRVSALSDSNRFQFPAGLLPLTPFARCCRHAGQGRGLPE